MAEVTMTELGRLIELWAAWYSIGVDGWLTSEESTHTCALEVAHTPRQSSSPQPPYPSDPELDELILYGINALGLQCSRLGHLSFSRSGTGGELTSVGGPIVALLEGRQTFFIGKYLSIFSELHRDYGDFGGHTMALDIAIENGHSVIHRTSLETNNRRRGLKLELWEPLTNALAAYEDLLEQGAALGHSLVDISGAEEQAGRNTDKLADTTETNVEKGVEGTEEDLLPEEPPHYRHVGLPFPCLTPTEASHLARLSNQIAPTHRAVARGTTLISTHPLRELAALITFVRFCEPLGAIHRM